MSILAATCATITAMLALAQPGDSVKLEGDCGEIVVANRFPARVAIDASKASVKGLRLTGENITWLGGVLVAPDGMDGFAARGYAVKITGTNVRLSNALITDAKKGVVVAGGRNVEISNNKFWRLREDGIIASATVNGQFDDNTFSEFLPRPTTCILPDGSVLNALSQRDCLSLNGTWKDGDHADAIQLRDGMENIRIRRNRIRGTMQGIAQMDTTGDRPLKKILIEGNDIETDGYHKITLTECLESWIKNNRVMRAPGSTKKAVILQGKASRCGNDVQDQAPDPICESN